MAASDTSTTVVIDGVDVTTRVQLDAYHWVTRTVTVPVVTAARQDQNGNDTADIPLMTTPGGGASLTAHLPTGYGLQTQGSQFAQVPAAAMLELALSIQARADEADRDALVEAASGWVLGNRDQWTTQVQTIMPTLAPGAEPAAPLFIDDADATTLLVIDTRNQGDGIHVKLEGIQQALVIGPGTFEQVTGRTSFVGDSASQTFIIDSMGDTVRAGGGDDLIVVGTGRDMWGGGTGNAIYGGDGHDVVQFSGASRSDYVLRLTYGLDNVRALSIHPAASNRDQVTYLDDIEALRFADAVADTSERGSVTRLYENLLQRTPDAGSLDYWMRKLANDGALEQVAAAILESDELAGQLPASDAAYVGWLYEHTVGRAPDAAGLSYWTGVLGSGEVSRADVALALSDSAESLQRSATTDLAIGASDVGVLIRMYAALYDRKPDDEGMNYWLGRSEDGTSLADIADAFVAADTSAGGLDDAAYIARLYQSALERAPTADELTDWSGMLADGRVDRGDVLLAIADSAEMTALVGVISSTIEVV